MTRIAGDSEARLRVKENWVTSQLGVLVAVCVGVAFLTGIGEGTAKGYSLSLELIVSGGISVMASAALFGAAWTTFAREVDLTPNGLTVRVGTRTVALSWADLVPPLDKHFVTSTFKYRKAGVVQGKDPLIFSRKQARAVLTYPSCPRYDLAPRIWESLGLPSRGPSIPN